MFKSKVKFLAVMACCSVLLLCSTIVFALGTQNFGGDVNIIYSAPKNVNIDEIWNSSTKNFNKSNLDNLLKVISNDSTSSTTKMSTVNSLATSKTTAAQMRSFTKGKDIDVTLGGLKWTVTYLSKDKSGNTILTLWLNDSIQQAWEERSSAEGEYFGYLNGGLYSDFSSGWIDSENTMQYPENMYGASYIRAVTLNNGGYYATSCNNLSNYTQDSNSAFALFTMPDGGLTDYLVTPRQVTWQEYGQNTKSKFGDWKYSVSNENWSSSIPSNGSYQGETYFFAYDYGTRYSLNYASKEYNDKWADDFLWLPSVCETGYDDSHIGIWDLSIDQRKNGDGGDSKLSAVGSKNIEKAWPADNYPWLRSGWRGNPNTGENRDYMASNLWPSGDEYYDVGVSLCCPVRPALHLNLTKAAQTAV